jgi:hypothetical protein
VELDIDHGHAQCVQTFTLKMDGLFLGRGAQVKHGFDAHVTIAFRAPMPRLVGAADAQSVVVKIALAVAQDRLVKELVSPGCAPPLASTGQIVL